MGLGSPIVEIKIPTAPDSDELGACGGSVEGLESGNGEVVELFGWLPSLVDELGFGKGVRVSDDWF